MFGKEMKYIVLCISIVMILGTGVSAAQEAKKVSKEKKKAEKKPAKPKPKEDDGQFSLLEAAS